MEHPTWEELTDYIDKRLSTDRHVIVETHIAVCDECAEQIEWLYKSTLLLRSDSFAPPPRRVRVSAESLFDLKYGKAVPTDAPAPERDVPVASPEAIGKVIVFPGTRAEPGDEDTIIRPAASLWRRFAWLGGAVAALLVLAIFASQAQQGPLVAAVQGQQGQVNIISSGNSLDLPFTDDTLSEGSAITTGADGSAQLVFADGTVRVTMLEDSNLVYIGGTESEGSLSRLALATDTAGDLEIDAQPGVTVDLQTGVGLFTTTGGRYRFHYLEPRIVGIQVLRGTVTVRSEWGVYDLHEGEDEVLDYSQPLPTPTLEPTMTATPTMVPPTPTALPSTPTRLPTRLPPSPTSNSSGSDGSSTGASTEPITIPDDSDAQDETDSNNGGANAAVATSTPPATIIPTNPETPNTDDPTGSEPVLEPEAAENHSDQEDQGNSGSGNHSDEEDSDDDNSGSGSNNSGSSSNNSGSGSGNSGSGGGDDDDD